jgi:hypothetical protein
LGRTRTEVSQIRRASNSPVSVIVSGGQAVGMRLGDDEDVLVAPFAYLT